jgi:hypothetical protein
VGAFSCHRSTLHATVCALIVAAAMPATSRADARAGALAVRCAVFATAQASIDHQPGELAISASDVARGFVDVPAGSRLTVTTNSRSGFVVDFLTRVPIFKSVDVRASGASGSIGPDGGTLVERRRSGRAMKTEIAYRFALADGVRPGVYPWPLTLRVRPL